MTNRDTLSRAVTGSIALAALTIGGVGLSATAADAATRSPWDAIAQCESGGNWSIDTGNGYSGGLQFSPGTWAAYGGRGSAAASSRAEQIAVGARVVAHQGWSAWGGCSARLGLSGHTVPATHVAHRTGRHRHTHDRTEHEAVVLELAEPIRHAAHAERSARHHAGAPHAARHVGRHAAHPVTRHAARHVEHHVDHHAVHHAGRHAAAPSSGTTTYTVRAGETLQGIAARLEVAGGWHALADASRLAHPGRIVPGQVLRLPA